MWGVPQVYFDEHLKPLREAVLAKWRVGLCS
jgi:hypothetical protein